MRRVREKGQIFTLQVEHTPSEKKKAGVFIPTNYASMPPLTFVLAKS